MRIVLTINSSITKYMSASRDRGNHVGSDVVFYGDAFEAVQEFVYHGFFVT